MSINYNKYKVQAALKASFDNNKFIKISIRKKVKKFILFCFICTKISLS